MYLGKSEMLLFGFDWQQLAGCASAEGREIKQTNLHWSLHVMGRQRVVSDESKQTNKKEQQTKQICLLWQTKCIFVYLIYSLYIITGTVHDMNPPTLTNLTETALKTCDAQTAYFNTVHTHNLLYNINVLYVSQTMPFSLYADRISKE